MLGIVLVDRCAVVNKDDAWSFILKCHHEVYRLIREILKTPGPKLHNSHLFSLDK